MTDLADYRVIFATPGTPPRTLHGVRPDDDTELTDWLVYVDRDDREVCRLNRDVVLFVTRLDDEAGGGEIRETGHHRGLARVAAAIRPAH